MAVASDASAAEVAAAKAKAESIAKLAQANPASFAELAKQSDDIATQQNGGDLGPIEKGIYGDEFDAAFFALNLSSSLVGSSSTSSSSALSSTSFKFCKIITYLKLVSNSLPFYNFVPFIYHMASITTSQGSVIFF
mgnify:CR=1 FL=1